MCTTAVTYIHVSPTEQKFISFGFQQADGLLSAQRKDAKQQFLCVLCCIQKHYLLTEGETFAICASFGLLLRGEFLDIIPCRFCQCNQGKIIHAFILF
mmetsp:Transcript_23292/g.55087  ORF Transcript_23292/g.55087 Transcript_23292/m.55087 type:complete len:98 (+) Transcript_23292:35-328(+)